ncbi:MAG: DUF2281 domain-containing protein [Phycisphaerae bacterium]|nr:DUF2281 domain-containing protein [Saprospiraceae bacterium]
MLYQEILNRETASLPDYLKRELLDFLYFLKKKGKKPLSVTEPLGEGGAKPAFGCGAVKIKIAPDFDAPLDDFKEYMS